MREMYCGSRWPGCARAASSSRVLFLVTVLGCAIALSALALRGAASGPWQRLFAETNGAHVTVQSSSPDAVADAAAAARGERGLGGDRPAQRGRRHRRPAAAYPAGPRAGPGPDDRRSTGRPRMDAGWRRRRDRARGDHGRHAGRARGRPDPGRRAGAGGAARRRDRGHRGPGRQLSGGDAGDGLGLDVHIRRSGSRPRRRAGRADRRPAPARPGPGRRGGRRAGADPRWPDAPGLDRRRRPVRGDDRRRDHAG